MAPTPSKQQGRRSFSSPSTSQASAEGATYVPASSGTVANSPSLARYKSSVPVETHVALLRILNGPDEYVKSSQIYNENKSLFGKPGSVDRAKVKNHRSYLEKLRKSNGEKFISFCVTHNVAVRVDQQASGEPSAPSRSMSRNYRDRRKWI
jgi:hypothetical protein